MDWPQNIAPHKLLRSHNFRPHYFKFKFYSIIKHSIIILTYHIFFDRKNIMLYIYKHNHDNCEIL